MKPSSPRFIDEYLPYLLAQASHRISADFHRQVNAAGLSVTEWRVLASLMGSAGETIGSLAALAITKQPTLSKVVQRMEVDGWVERVGVRADRRQTHVRITQAGQRLVTQLCDQALLHQREVLAAWDAEQSVAFLSMLKTLIQWHDPAQEDERDTSDVD